MVSVEDGRLLARAPDGTALPSAAVLGLELTVLDSLDRPIRVRIDDEAEPYGTLPAYAVSRLDEAGGGWVPLCAQGLDGRRVAIALPGRWRDAGAGAFVEDPLDFTLTCTAGANAKCARLGYVPGARTGDDESLTPWFEACVRMMRADYCGDGRSYTEAGVPVELRDRDGRRSSVHAHRMGFEAVWGRRGAVCVRRPRDRDRVSLLALAERCPRLAEATGDRCREDALASDPEALLASRSPQAHDPPR